MKRSEFLYISLSALLLFIFLVPFLYISRYANLSADDFCRATTELDEYWWNVRNWYLHHNGRFANALFSYLPVYGKDMYRLMAALGIIGVGGAIFIFIRELIRFYDIGISLPKLIFVSIIFYIVLIAQVPSVFEFFYWYASTTAYTYSLIFFLLILSYFLKPKVKQKKYIGIAAVLILLATGNHEMLLLLINLLLLLILGGSFYKKRVLDQRILFLNIVSWIGVVVVYFSPGRLALKEEYVEGGDVFYSLINAFLSAGMFSFKSFLEIPYLFFYIFVFLFFHCKNKKGTGNRKGMHPVILAILSLIGLATVFFVPYYAIGYVKVNENRIGNMIHGIFLILVFFNLVNLSVNLKEFKIKEGFNFVQWLSLAFFIIIVGFTSPSYIGLRWDFQNENFEELDAALEKRNKTLLRSTKEEIILDEIRGGRTIKHLEIGKNVGDWSNQCYTNMINKIFQTNFISIRSQ